MSVKNASIRSTPIRKQRTSSRQNIREAYIDYVKTTNSLKKSQSISNLENCDVKATTSSSNYLEDQYSLVKRILTASSALEKLKKSARDGNNNSNDLKSSRSVTGKPFYKTQEEYYEEVMGLKKKLKHFEKNETIMKAKLDYYENELTKKYQEIEVLLDSKTSGEKISSLKSDLRQTLGLKKKIFKLEMKVREKDNKLQKIETDLKTTSLREMRIANDIMKQEIQRLNECLLNTARVTQNFSLLSDRDTNRTLLNKENLNGNTANEIELKALRIENQNLIERLQKLLNEKQNDGGSNSQLRKLSDDYKKLCKDKDNEISRLKKELGHKTGSSNSSSNSSDSSRSPSPAPSSKPNIQQSLQSVTAEIVKRKPSPALSKHSDSSYELADAINTLQSVFRGHHERIKYNKEIMKEEKPVKKAPSLNNSLIEHKKQSPSPSRNKTKSPSLSRHNSNESLTKGQKNVTESKLNNSFKNTKSNKSFNDDDDVIMD